MKKDPDVNAPYVFLLGETMAKRWGELKKGFMPYQWQSYYFHLCEYFCRDVGKGFYLSLMPRSKHRL